jgi:uncharacterized protein YjbI with pentapeptide repeats
VAQTADPRSRQFREVSKLLGADVLGKSFAALRDAHAALKEYGDQPDLAELLEMFLKNAAQSGKSISDSHSRSKAQSIIDYWSLRLAAVAPNDRSYDVHLEEADIAKQPAGGRAGDQPAAAEKAQAHEAPKEPEPRTVDAKPADDSDQIAIRFAAAARLWRDTHQMKGFLLDGDALKLGAKFRQRDPAINALVTESENSIRKRKRRNAAWLAGSLLGTVALIFWVHSWLFPWLCKWEALQAATFSRDNPTQDEIDSLEWRFARISFYQRFMPAGKVAEVYLTSARFSQLNLRGISLPAANFIQTKFSKVELDGANLPNSFFSESPGIDNVDFTRANLSYSNFRSSSLTGETSFEGANLYRANFDYTNLCGVDFAGARLRKASFRDVYLDSVDGFANSGWWLASGWNSQNYYKLLGVEDTEEEILKSAGFSTEVEEARGYFAGTAAGTVERAMALNSYALTLASWGFKSPTEQVFSIAGAPDCMSKNDIPDDALAASEESVCILESTTTRNVQHLEQIAYDTLGYLQMQRNDLQNALASFRNSEAIQDDGGHEFRYAVTLYATGQEAEALAKLDHAMVKRQYVPSHELKTLKHLLFAEDGTPNDLLKRVMATIDARWPKSERTCS